jgi:hypothetical protein
MGAPLEAKDAPNEWQQSQEKSLVQMTTTGTRTMASAMLAAGREGG